MMMRCLMVPLCALTMMACASQPKTGDGAQDATNAVEKKDAPAAGVAKIPDFTLETIEGEKWSLSDHVGSKVIVMSFWATWCMPCLAELPHLSELYQKEKANGLEIVAVAMDEPSTVAEVAPTAQRLGLTLPVVLDTEQRAVKLYNRARNAPMTVVIDKKGRIVRASSGYNPGDEAALAQEVRSLLQN